MQSHPNLLAVLGSNNRCTGATAAAGATLFALIGLATFSACTEDAPQLFTLDDVATQGDDGAQGDTGTQSDNDTLSGTQSDAGTLSDAGADARAPTPAPSVFDALFAALLADLEAQPAEQRPFTRYLGLGHRRLAGASEAELRVERAALSLALNSTSTRAELVPAVAVDAEASLYRIDLRAYGWDRELEVAATPQRDGWEAVIAGNPYAIAFSGSEADELARLANTAVPFVYAEVAVRALANGDVYHALASVPVTLDSDPLPWGIDRAAMSQDLEVVRAGNWIGAHIASDEDVRLDRYLSPQTSLPVWLSSGSFAGGDASIFDDPFEFGRDETFVAFSLPNGLLGYGIYDPNGERRTASEVLPKIQNPSSCFGCHVEGPVRMVDMVRDVVEANPGEFSPDTVEAFAAVYPPQEELDALFAGDQSAYRAQLTRLGVPGELGADVIPTTIDQFERPLSLAQAAAELGVEPERLSSSLGRLAPELAGLAGGLEVSRSDFSRVFSASLCALYADAPRHRPVTASCPRR